MNATRGRWFLPVTMVAIVIMAGCRDSSAGNLLANLDSTSLTQGIAGEVVQSPMQPVARPGEIDWAPLAGATITIARAGGNVVGRVVSDSPGRFHVELDPGSYLLTPQPFPNRMLPSPPSAEHVEIHSGGVARVRFDYDTGIR